MNPDLNVVVVPVVDLVPDPENARKHSAKNLEAIAGSLRLFGQRRPLVVHGQVVIAGNGTLEAAKSLGWTHVAITRTPADWSVEQARAYALADNRTAELASWDDRVLADQLVELDAVGWDLSEIGFEALHPPVGDVIGDVATIEPPNDPETRLGDVWRMGRHVLICGDATDQGTYRRIFDGHRATICFTSPPYNAGKSESLSGNTHMTTNKYGDGYDDDRQGAQWLNLCNASTAAVLQHSDYAVINVQMLAGNKTSLLEYMHTWRNRVADIAIWDKGHAAPAMAERVMNSRFEFLVILSHEENPSRAIRSGSFRGNLDNVVSIGPQRSNEFSVIHAATFPKDLPAWGIRNFSAPGDLILDCFAGTGTTMIAADALDRSAVLIEMDPRYCDVIVRRWEDLTGQKATREHG